MNYQAVESNSLDIEVSVETLFYPIVNLI